MVIKVFLSDGLPLKQYHVEFSAPDEWNEYIVKLRAKYVNSEEIVSEPRDLLETLRALEAIVRLDFPAVSEELIEPLTWGALNLLEFYLLLSDKEISEVFCSHMGSNLVITHRKYGRCATNLVFSQELWRAIKRRAEYDSGQALTPLSPALKVGFDTDLGSLRVSLQVEPLSPEGPAFTVRRLPQETLTIDDLVRQGQISSSKAEYLIRVVKDRNNVIIAGEPGSGKTTLANALLLHTEPSWRLIVIEDAREVRFPHERFPLLTRYSMPAVGAENRRSQRTSEIARLLHRSPDYVFLGEIQTMDDTKATMEAFAAGIRGMATTHGRDLDGLMARWVESHQMTTELLRIIDVIVFTTRELDGEKAELRVGDIFRRKDDDGGFAGFQKVRLDG